MAKSTPKSSLFRTVEKWLSDVQREARILGNAALAASHGGPAGERAWDIIYSTVVHVIDERFYARLEKAHEYGRTLDPAAKAHFGKAIKRLWRGSREVSKASSHHKRNPARLRWAALLMYDGASDAYSLMHHKRYYTLEGYLSTRKSFKESLRARREEVSRNLRMWPAHGNKKRKAKRNARTGRFTRKA